MADSVQQGTESPELCNPIPDHSYYKVKHAQLPTSINLHCKDRNITISCVVKLRVPLYRVPLVVPGRVQHDEGALVCTLGARDCSMCPLATILSSITNGSPSIFRASHHITPHEPFTCSRIANPAPSSTEPRRSRRPCHCRS